MTGIPQKTGKRIAGVRSSAVTAAGGPGGVGRETTRCCYGYPGGRSTASRWRGVGWKRTAETEEQRESLVSIASSQQHKVKVKAGLIGCAEPGAVLKFG